MWVGVCLLLAACAAAPSAYAQTYGTVVTLDPLPSWVYAGDAVAFSGTLTSGGYALPGRTVLICEDDPFIPDECLASATTGSDGRFGVWWTAEAGTLEIDFDIYAEFRGDGTYGRDQTPRYTMGVYKYGGSIVLDPIPASAAFGEVVALSGTLTLDGHSPEGAIVYVKDEDTLNPDDLLTAAYVSPTGRFTTSWFVEDVDPNDTVEIQAVFEGNALYNRLASPIQKMRTYEDPLRPDPSPSEGDGYMELYRSLSFGQAPRVLIVPSIDSYDKVRKHIFPVQEGIMLLTAMLEREYGDGNWNVEFEVMGLGKGFAEREPDIIVNLVTRDEDSGCGSDYADRLGARYGRQADTDRGLLDRGQDRRGRGLDRHARVHTCHRRGAHLQHKGGQDVQRGERRGHLPGPVRKVKQAVAPQPGRHRGRIRDGRIPKPKQQDHLWRKAHFGRLPERQLPDLTAGSEHPASRVFRRL